MKRIIFFVLLFTIVLKNNAQSLSKTYIIYEHKDLIVLNDGKQYQIVHDKPFYEVYDTTIQPYIESSGHLLRLNRVITLKSKNKYLELIEWVKESNLKLYKSRKLNKAPY